MNPNLRLITYGVLTWLLPFISSFFFYSKNGSLSIDIFLFKSIMILISGSICAILIARYFLFIKQNYLDNGVKLGIIWTVINLGLDASILLPITKMSTAIYIQQIGLRYGLILIMASMLGYVLEKKSR